MSDNTSQTPSAASCIKAGLNLFRNNFTLIIRRTWIAVMLYAVASSVLSMLIINNYSRIIVAETAITAGFEIDTSWVIPLIIYILVAAVAVTVCSAAYSGHIFKMLSEHSETGAIEQGKWFRLRFPLYWRSLKAILFTALIVIVLSIMTALISFGIGKVLSPKTAMIATAILSLALLLTAVLPIGYSIMRYMTLRPTTFFGSYLHALRIQWSHYGLLFGVMFITGIIAIVLMAVILLPGNILYIANIQSQLGVFNGDEPGMPAHMMWLFPIVMWFVAVMQAYISTLLSFPVYYLEKAIDNNKQAT